MSVLAAGESMILIEAHHLHRSFGETVAVQDIDLQVSAGEIYGLVGPDGAGKTTVMRLLCGALRPGQADGVDPAQIKIAGYDLPQELEQARAQIGYLPQRFSLYEELSVLENIRFFAEVRGLSAARWQPRCLEILEFVGLEAFQDRRAGYLSGGMKQKLGLAAALVHEPRVLLLDEPTTGVDPVTRQDFWQLIFNLIARQNEEHDATAVLVSTPYMDEATRCQRIGFMSGGRLIQTGTPAELQAALKERILELTGEPLPLLRKLAAQVPGIEDVQLFGDRLHLRVGPEQSQAVIERLNTAIPDAGGVVTHLRVAPAGLEDVFMSLLEDK